MTEDKVDPDKYADAYGKPPTDDQLQRIAEHFGGTLEELKHLLNAVDGDIK